MQSSSGSGGNPHDRPRLYTGSPNPLIRVDSHDRLEGYPPTDPPSAHPSPSPRSFHSLAGPPPTTHRHSSSTTASSTCGSWSTLSRLATRPTNDLRLKNDGFSAPFLSPICSPTPHSPRPIPLCFSLNYNLDATIYFRSLAFFHGRASAPPGNLRILRADGGERERSEGRRGEGRVGEREVRGRRFYPLFLAFYRAAAKPPERLPPRFATRLINDLSRKKTPGLFSLRSSRQFPISISRRRWHAPSLCDSLFAAFCSAWNRLYQFVTSSRPRDPRHFRASCSKFSRNTWKYHKTNAPTTAKSPPRYVYVGNGDSGGGARFHHTRWRRPPNLFHGCVVSQS